MEKGAVNDFINVAFKLGEEILDRDKHTELEQEFLRNLDKLSEIIVKN